MRLSSISSITIIAALGVSACSGADTSSLAVGQGGAAVTSVGGNSDTGGNIAVGGANANGGAPSTGGYVGAGGVARRAEPRQERAARFPRAGLGKAPAA